MARLHKLAKAGDRCKGKAGTSVAAPSSRVVVPPTAPVTRPSDRPETRVSRLKENRPTVAVPTTRSHQEDLRPRDNTPTASGAEPIRRKSSAQKALVSKFDDKLTSEVAESPRRSDPIIAFDDCADKLIKALCLAFSKSAAARGYANRMEEAVSLAEAEDRRVRDAEKKAEDKAKAAEEKVKAAEERAKDAEKKTSEAEATCRKVEDALRKAESDLASARSEYARYIQVPLPAAIEDAWQQAVEDFMQSEDFNSRLVAEYKKGMQDMKAGFVLTNPTVSGETAAKEEGVREVKEEEVTGAARVPEDVVVLDEPEQLAASEQPTNVVPDARASHYTLPDQLE
ncbi:hypothetical protein TIFTF001_017760 [Ficus carica]|uniref:Uncharacterized protein n=1 Tax=Ficus carica TaxID=3494 RepID=A0AA88A2Z7_FICCA|nr:hypothetical protein TIFTF001_017760 [Ficus carica]